MVMPESCWTNQELGNPKTAQIIHPRFTEMIGTFISDYETKYKNR